MIISHLCFLLSSLARIDLLPKMMVLDVGKGKADPQRFYKHGFMCGFPFLHQYS